MQDLQAKILRDLSSIGIDTDSFELVLKPYSKTFYGCFRAGTNRVYLYVFQDSSHTIMYDYSALIKTAIHEAVHAMQWHDKNHPRLKGIMHDAEFYQLLNLYEGKYNEYCNKGCEIDTQHYERRGKPSGKTACAHHAFNPAARDASSNSVFYSGVHLAARKRHI